MDANLAKLLESGVEFIKTLKPSDRILIVHHMDADGYCSAAILLHTLESLGIKNITHKSSDVEALKEIICAVKSGEFDKIIILDIDAPALKPEFERINAETLIVDHHMVRTDLNGRKLTYVNPRLADGELYQPASYVVYKIASLIADSKDVEWLAALGTIADYAYEDCRDVIENFSGIRSRADIPDSELWKASKILYGAIIYANSEGSKIGHKKLVDSLLSAGGVDELVAMSPIKSASKKFENEYERAKRDFLKSAKTEGSVTIGILGSQMKRLCAALSTDLSVEHSDRTIIVLERRGGRLKVSARRQDGSVHLGKMMEKCAHGGGHRNAAGGSIAEDELEDFKACVFRELGV